MVVLHRLSFFVAKCDLLLRVRAQPRQRRVLLLAHLGLLLDQAMREMDRGGHVAARLVGGVAEHQALVAGALLFGLLAVDALVDVGGRSEERRVGKECVSTCRYRWSLYH